MKVNDTWANRASKIAAARARIETAERKRQIAARARQTAKARKARVS